MVERYDVQPTEPARAEARLVAARMGGWVRYADHVAALAMEREAWIDLVDNLVGFLKDAGELEPFGGTLGGEVVAAFDRARRKLIDRNEQMLRKMRGGEV